MNDAPTPNGRSSELRVIYEHDEALYIGIPESKGTSSRRSNSLSICGFAVSLWRLRRSRSQQSPPIEASGTLLGRERGINEEVCSRNIDICNNDGR